MDSKFGGIESSKNLSELRSHQAKVRSHVSQLSCQLCSLYGRILAGQEIEEFLAERQQHPNEYELLAVEDLV